MLFPARQFSCGENFFSNDRCFPRNVMLPFGEYRGQEVSLRHTLSRLSERAQRHCAR